MPEAGSNAMNITETLSNFAAGLTFQDLPPIVRERTKYLMLDSIGNIICARYDSESTPALLAAVRAMGLAQGSARVFSDPDGYSPAGAALINGALAHSLDFDDTHAAAIVHPGAPIIPSVLAAAETADASGAEVIAAIAVGYEVALRLALALPAGAHYDRGFHPTATCGSFGAAAAAARVFRLSPAQIASAFGIALSQTAGSLQFLDNGAWTKRFQVGWAGMAGFAAACLAREGFKGAAQPIEGKHGFLNAYSPAPVPERVLQDLGQSWELMQTGVKPYPSCRWGHAGIDAALALRAEHGFVPEQIEAVTLGLSRAGMLLIGEPAEKKARPENIVDAQFSAPFVLATALSTGAMGWSSYDRLSDPETQSLMRRVQCKNDPEIEAEFPANMSGKLTVRAGGQNFVKKVIVPKGEPENFLSAAELTAKFMGLARQRLSAAQAEALAQAVLALDQLNNAAALFPLGMPEPR
jgi:2-methylcitrate dehydratase PrpD